MFEHVHGCTEISTSVKQGL